MPQWVGAFTGRNDGKKRSQSQEAEAVGIYRLLASIVIAPHVKHWIAPEKLLPFPWDKMSRRKGKTKTADTDPLAGMTKKERSRRMADFVKSF